MSGNKLKEENEELMLVTFNNDDFKKEYYKP